jgi:hypothetical protein
LVDSTIEQWWSWHNGVVLGESGSYPGVKYRIDDPWYIAWEEKDHELTPPHGDPKGPAVLFSEYLQWALDVELPLSGPRLKFPHTTNAK